MNSQDLSNLQEAYLEVYQLDEIFGLGKKKGTSPRADAIINSPEFKKRMEDADKIAIQNLRDMMSGDKKRQNRVAMHPDNRTDLNYYKEETDLYDLILSHLLDEGYADTQEQAEAIMVNMSEDWRESIVEEVLDEAAIYKRGGKGQTTETPLQIYGKSATAREKKKLHNIPKGRIGADEVGDYDRGSGNAAKRRAAALTKPEAKKFPNRLTRSDKQGIKDSYEYQLDEKIATPPSWWNARRGLDSETRRRRRSRDFDTYGGENQEDLYGKERTISTSKGEGGITKNPKKLRKQKAMGEFREQVDIYDIILSHLLDEGYAETPEQAEVIMVNMSEDWRESIVEGYKSFPHGKVEAKAKRLEADSRTNEPLAGKSDSEVDSILARKKKSGERANSLNLASRTSHSYLPQKKAERNKTQKEQVDLYDLILSHLLDEGYAETPEQAEVIMVNMSEDWRESICEEYKKLPVGKMVRKAVEIGLRSEHPAGRLDTRMAGRKRGAKMAKVADEHDPAKAKRKEDDNRREGGRKRDAGRPRSNELQDNW